MGRWWNWGCILSEENLTQKGITTGFLSYSKSEFKNQAWKYLEKKGNQKVYRGRKWSEFEQTIHYTMKMAVKSTIYNLKMDFDGYIKNV